MSTTETHTKTLTFLIRSKSMAISPRGPLARTTATRSMMDVKEWIEVEEIFKPKFLPSYMAFARQNFTDENVRFVVAANELQSTVNLVAEIQSSTKETIENRKDFQEMFRIIYTIFLENNGQGQKINVSGPTKKTLEEENARKHFTLATFIAIRNQIKKDIMQHSLAHFKKTEDYQKIVTQAAKPEDSKDKAEKNAIDANVNVLVTDLNNFLTKNANYKNETVCCCFSRCKLDKSAIYENISNLRDWLVTRNEESNTGGIILAAMTKHNKLSGKEERDIAQKMQIALTTINLIQIKMESVNKISVTRSALRTP